MSPNTNDFNEDELVAPEWLNAEFLTKVLIECEKDASSEIVVNNFKLSPGTGKGDHYASIMFRAEVDYSKGSAEKSKSMIIKTMPEDEGHKKELLQESIIFETEIGMYTEVIPKFEEILRSVGDNTVLGGNCIYHSLSPKKLIIFEDLVPQGYSVIRNRQVNLDEAKMAYSKLAKWHAVSYKINLEQPSFFDKYHQSFMAVPNMMDNEFVKDGTKLFIEILEEYPSLRKFKPFFEALQPTLLKKCYASFQEFREQPQAAAHYVLNHGDFHSKNIMCKHDTETGKIVDLMLLDFQLSYIGPLVNDLIYSVFMLLDYEVRSKHFDELIYYYHTQFVETLEKIGYEGNVPKLSEIRAQLAQHSHIQLFLMTTFLPMWYGLNAGNVDPSELMQSADARRKLYRIKGFIEEMEIVLPKYLHLGYLENL